MRERFKSPLEALDAWVAQRSPRVLGKFDLDFLLAVALAIVLGVFQMTWWLKLLLLAFLAVILAEIAWRMPLPRSGKILAAILAAVATFAFGYGPVVDQYNTDAVFRDYKTTRDLVAKYQSRDASLKMVVAQYDKLKDAQFRVIGLGSNQSSEIDRQSIEDLKNVLRNFDVVVTTNGSALRIKLGLNMYRIIFPVPMRVIPNLFFSELPVDSKASIIEATNLGFTVLFIPLSIPVEHFGLMASAEP